MAKKIQQSFGKTMGTATHKETGLEMFDGTNVMSIYSFFEKKRSDPSPSTRLARGDECHSD